MATYDNLKTAWSSRITAQYAYDNDAINYQTALVNLDLYISALTVEATSAANDIQSYSIGGQSVTKRTNVTNTSNVYLKQLKQYCKAGGCSVDNFNSGNY